MFLGPLSQSEAAVKRLSHVGDTGNHGRMWLKTDSQVMFLLVERMGDIIRLSPKVRAVLGHDLFGGRKESGKNVSGRNQISVKMKSFLKAWR